MIPRSASMLSRPLARRSLPRRFVQTIPALTRPTQQQQTRWVSQADIDDPNMNGGYINPPRIKRQFRDPYGDWWDKQERRNFGEPVHEDDDILGIFTPEEYTHTSPGKAILQIGFFISAVFGLAYIVGFWYPDVPAVSRTFEDGLEAELGGPGALRAKKEGEEAP
ncbi:MAG: hypothetical protein M1823_004126 [Watsoniomyces obsoletus]|nr:MAG: hypothetical protein M1823_004126 [Watsoniomyces obsoletus]